MATILSAQCTDARVNLVTPALFARFPTAHDYAAATPADIEPFIRSAGFFRAKAKNIHAFAVAVIRDHGGEVPRTLDELVKPCPASAARPRTSSSATPSTPPASRSIRTSAGCRGGSG